VTTATGTAYEVRALGPDTWDAFAALAERHNGVWGGCWCLAFHPRDPAPDQALEPMERARCRKRQLVLTGRAHAALVMDGDVAVGWCQYGSPEELPRITHRSQVEALQERPPDYRITCFFVDRHHRRGGFAVTALRGALDLIARAGGGLVEAYPYDTAGERASSSFLWSGTRAMFEQAGFAYVAPKGKRHCIVRRTVAPA